MRAFFKEILYNLYIYVGNRQTEKMTDDEIKFLLDSLERMSKLYSYIPEQKQKEIILTCLVSDREYQNINVRTVSKWLELNGKIFFTQKHHEENKSNPNYKPLEGEERDKAIQIYLDTLAKVQTNWSGEAVKGSGSKMREEFDKVAPMPESESALNQYCNDQANKEGTKGDSENTETSVSETNPPEQNDLP